MKRTFGDRRNTPDNKLSKLFLKLFGILAGWRIWAQEEGLAHVHVGRNLLWQMASLEEAQLMFARGEELVQLGHLREAEHLFTKIVAESSAASRDSLEW